MAESTWATITSRMAALDPWYKRVDIDRNRLRLHPFQLKNYDNKTKLEDVINVTENKSVTYAQRIIANLMSGQWQAVVEGELNAKETQTIEGFLEDVGNQCNEYISEEYGIPDLNVWLCNHVCHTSIIGVQYTSRLENGELVVHCCPVDMRWTPFVLNKWVAPITYRSKDEVLQELEKFEKVAMDGVNKEYISVKGGLKDTDNEVRDYWDTEKHELWIGGSLTFREKNTYKKPPFVIVVPPSGFMFRDKGYLEYESPGLLFANSSLYDEISRQLSIDATLGFDPILPAYQRPVKSVRAGVSEAAPKRGESRDLPAGELFELMPRPDINRASLTSRDELNRLVVEAAPIAPASYTQPPSAVEVATEIELLNQYQNPRVIALQSCKRMMARTQIDQFILANEMAKEAGSKVVVGRRGSRRQYSITELKDPDKYFITYKLLPKNKRMDIINEGRALALWGRAPTRYILRDVLSVEDVDGWLRELALKEAHDADPAIALMDMGLKYVQEAMNIEDEVEANIKKLQSMLLLDRAVTMIKQRMTPQNLPQEAQMPVPEAEIGNSQGLISMMGRAASGTPGVKSEGGM